MTGDGRPAGWYWQTGRTRAHYFPRGRSYSLCNAVGRQLVEARDRQHCGTCERTLAAQQRYAEERGVQS